LAVFHNRVQLSEETKRPMWKSIFGSRSSKHSRGRGWSCFGNLTGILQTEI